jgi:AcrR family transcriptional regulator
MGATRKAAGMTPRTYASPKRAAAAERTRQRLVRAAVKLMKSKAGPRSVSLDSVARAAGVSRLTVYNQFGSRRGLFEALFDERARHGGMHRMAQIMAGPDPRAGLDQLIELFCEFWSNERSMIACLSGAAGSDKQLSEGLLARNERRRRALTVLIGRMELLHAPPQAISDLVDVLFVLTSFAVFIELARPGRGGGAVCRLIKDLAGAAIERCASSLPGAGN